MASGAARAGRREHREEARELAPDLLEHLEIPAGHRVAGPGQRPGRRHDLADGARDAVSVGRAPDRPEEVADPHDGEADRLRPAEVVLDAPRQILLADRLARLLRRPCREGAPVGAGARERGQGSRELGIGLRDAEISHDRIGGRADRLDLHDRRSARGRARGERAGALGLRHGWRQTRLLRLRASEQAPARRELARERRAVTGEPRFRHTPGN